MVEEQLDFFNLEETKSGEVNQFTPPKPVTLEERVTKVIKTIKHGVLAESWEPCNSLSGGKDSMTSLSLSLVGMALAMKEYPVYLTKPVFHIVSSDTKMENLAKEDYLNTQLERAVKFGKENGFKVMVHRPAPDRTASFLRIFAGSRPDPTPSINNKTRQCANDYKISPIHTAMRGVNKLANTNGKKLVMIVGSRSAESTDRAESLAKVQASDTVPILKKGYWTLYPVMDWSLEDIWNYLMFAENDFDAKLPGYQDSFQDVVELYSSLNGGECVQGLEQGQSSCGARDGCHQCGIVTKDKSGINQANSKELYHMKRTLSALLSLRDYRITLGKNYQNRNFVSMTDDKGRLVLKPNGYAGWLLEENLRIALTIQQMEMQRAYDQRVAVLRMEERLERGGVRNPRRARKWLRRVKRHAKPLLNWLEPSDILWIDFQWSLRGVTRESHSAIRIWDEVVNKGKWAKIPKGDFTRPDHVTNEEYMNVTKQPTYAAIDHFLDLSDNSLCHFADSMSDMFEGHCTETTTHQINQAGEAFEGEQFNVEVKYSVNDETADWICYDPSLVIKSRDDMEPYEFRHQNAVRRLLRIGAINVNNSQLRDIGRKLELLEFTATEGLQERAYIGGQLQPGENPKAELADGQTILMFD
tara:strand:+ start:2625 stop:4550 length:1926 start_codon:yes stop_codon:yes gene_type:complete